MIELFDFLEYLFVIPLSLARELERICERDIPPKDATNTSGGKFLHVEASRGMAVLRTRYELATVNWALGGCLGEAQETGIIIDPMPTSGAFTPSFH